MNRSSLSIALLPFALCACSSDSSDGPAGCTEIGCTDGLAVTFRASSWPQGAYRLDVTADGLVYDCETTLPFASDVPVTCSSQDISLEVSGTLLPPDQQAISGMRLFPLAETVQVTLSRDGLPLATQTFHPQYQPLQPNGPACEPTCQAFETAMDI